MSKHSIYKKRRELFAQHMQVDSIALIESSPTKIRNNDSTYRYRQCSNFYYLTGYNNPDSVLFIYKNKRSSTSHFFSKKPNKHDSVWSGDLLSSNMISKIYGFDKCGYLEDLAKELNIYLKGSKSVYHSLTKDSPTANILDSCMLKIEQDYRKGVELPSNQFSAKKIIHQLRLIKSEDEISLIKKACSISAQAHKNLMRTCKPNISEKKLESIIDWELAHIGNPMEDLGWLCVRSWRFGNVEKRAAGLGDIDDLIAGYESNSKIKVDKSQLDIWQLYGSLKWGIICMIQTFAHLSGAVNSLEKAAIGRRVSETEFDLMNMIKNKNFL